MDAPSLEALKIRGDAALSVLQQLIDDLRMHAVELRKGRWRMRR